MGKPAPLGVGADMTPPAGDLATNVLQGMFSAVGPSQPFTMYGWGNVMIWGAINTSLTTTAGSLNATVASGTGLAAGVAVNSALVPKGTVIASISGTAAVLKAPAETLPGSLRADGTIAGLPLTAGLLGAAVTGPNIPAGATVVEIVQAAVLQPSYPGAPSTPGIVRLSAAPTAIATQSYPQFFTFTPTGNAIVTGVDAGATFTGAAILYSGAAQLEYSVDGAATWLVANFYGGGTLAQWTNGVPTRASVAEGEKGVLYRLNCTALTAATTMNYRISMSGQAAGSLSLASPV